MRTSSLFSIVLLVSTPAIAQQTPAVVEAGPAPSLSCPVDFSIAANPQFAVRIAGEQTRNDTQSLLKITLQPVDALLVRSATIRVHGISSANQVVLTAPSQEKVETVHLHGEGRASLQSQEVALKSIRFAHWAEITELRYADGTTWRSSETQSCRADSKGFQLVGQ